MLGDHHPEGGDHHPEGDHHLEEDRHQGGEDPNPEGGKTLIREEEGLNGGGLRLEDLRGTNQSPLNLQRGHRQRGEEDRSLVHHQRGGLDLHREVVIGTDHRASKLFMRNL